MLHVILVLISIISGLLLTTNSECYPFNVESHNLSIDIENHKIKFTGNVTIKHGNMYIITEKMIICYKNRQIDKIFFLNKVQIIKDSKIISGVNAEYSKHFNFLKIIGNVRYINGSQQVLGNYFTHHFKTKISKLSTK